MSEKYTIQQLQDMEPAELLEVYNLHADKPVSKFASRPKGIERTVKLLQERNALADSKHAVGSVLTWMNPEVRAARAARHNVVVNGEDHFRSVRAAFKALGFPDSHHSKFRAQLKQEGSLKYDGVLFEIAEQEKEAA